MSLLLGGVPYMIKNGATGLLFDCDNHDELAQKMFWAIRNQTIARAIIQQAHRTIANYCWENVKNKLYQAYGIPS